MGSRSPGKKRRARPWDQTDGDTRQNNRRLRKEGQIAKETLRTYKVGGKGTEVEGGALEDYDSVTSFLVRGQAWVKDGNLFLSHAGKLGGGQDVGAHTVASEPAGTE